MLTIAFSVLRMNARRRPPGVIYRIQAITRPLADSPCTNMNETGTETRSRSWPLAEDCFDVDTGCELDVNARAASRDETMAQFHRHRQRSRLVNDWTRETCWTVDLGRQSGLALAAGRLGTHSAQEAARGSLGNPPVAALGCRGPPITP